MSIPALIAVDLVVLRGAIGDAVLRPGMVLGGKVVERSGAHGLLLLNGAPVVAQLPEEVAAGARLRLRVAEAGADRVLLQVLPEPDAAGTTAATTAQAQPAAPVVTVPLPGGLQAQLRTEPDGGEGDRAGRAGRGGGVGAVWLRLDSPQLGRLDVRVDALSCAVAVSAGPPTDAAREALPALREALARAVGRPLLVTLHPRTSALDVCA